MPLIGPMPGSAPNSVPSSAPRKASDAEALDQEIEHQLAPSSGSIQLPVGSEMPNA